jgi:PAP2 superfamily protein
VIGCLLWVYIWHRRTYPQVRTTLVLFTAGALLIQLVPVAPPRMLPGDNMIDTAVQYGQSVYGSVAGFNADQLSAMPSVHVGWALLVALVVVQVSRSHWRWLVFSYPALTLLAVVVTANHFWLDGIAAAVLLALALLLQRAGRIARGRLRAGYRARAVRRQASYPDDSVPPRVPAARP